MERMTMIMMMIIEVKCTELGQYRVEYMLICVSHVVLRGCKSILL
jgi:hypothetical protein